MQLFVLTISNSCMFERETLDKNTSMTSRVYLIYVATAHPSNRYTNNPVGGSCYFCFVVLLCNKTKRLVVEAGQLVSFLSIE